MTRTRAVTAALLAVGVLAIGVVVVLSAIDSDDDTNGAARPTTITDRFVIGRTPAGKPFVGLTETDLAVGGRCRHLVVADSLDERVQGLTGRSDLGSYDGMLFVFDTPTTTPFTMSGVPVPLEIGFYAADGSPVSRRHLRPCSGARADCPSYTASGPFSYALETSSGELPTGALSSCN